MFDPNIPDIDESRFNLDTYWKKFHSIFEEEDPQHMQEQLGKLVMMTAFVDANYAGNAVTQ